MGKQPTTGKQVNNIIHREGYYEEKGWSQKTVGGAHFRYGGPSPWR